MRRAPRSCRTPPNRRSRSRTSRRRCASSRRTAPCAPRRRPTAAILGTGAADAACRATAAASASGWPGSGASWLGSGRTLALTRTRARARTVTRCEHRRSCGQASLPKIAPSPDAHGAPQLHTTSAPAGGGEAEGVPPRYGERAARCSLGGPLDLLREWHGFAPIARQVRVRVRARGNRIRGR